MAQPAAEPSCSEQGKSSASTSRASSAWLLQVGSGAADQSKGDNGEDKPVCNELYDACLAKEATKAEKLPEEALHPVTQRLIDRFGVRSPEVLKRIEVVYCTLTASCSGGLSAVEFRGYLASVLTQIRRELEDRPVDPKAEGEQEPAASNGDAAAQTNPTAAAPEAEEQEQAGDDSASGTAAAPEPVVASGGAKAADESATQSAETAAEEATATGQQEEAGGEEQQAQASEAAADSAEPEPPAEAKAAVPVAGAKAADAESIQPESPAEAKAAVPEVGAKSADAESRQRISDTEETPVHDPESKTESF
eukprot:TRINITY_DN10520_c0_g1_i2.p1 TRINITY_DN10520_c0_g1~~TRINITY_DN10520_c0_g1_i2.p1  ORF type:complete len:308 (+),score=93.67 TRINITY_DN10520_c0_g1_i2:48-971(+)